MEIRKKLYVFLFTVLGLVFGMFLAELAQLFYLKLLLSDFIKYSHGLSWDDLWQLYYLFSIALVAICGFWGFGSGKYWWNQIYVLKRFKGSRWQSFFK